MLQVKGFILHFPMSTKISCTNPTFPIRMFPLLPEHTEYPKDSNLDKVHVVWDLDTCPLRDEDNHYQYDVEAFRENINRALRSIHSTRVLTAEDEIYAIGDTSLLKDSNGNEGVGKTDMPILEEQGVRFVHCDKRLLFCGTAATDCTEPPYAQKQTPSACSILGQRYALAITGDYDFSEPLTMMRQRGFRTLLAQPQIGYPPFRDVTYFTWF
ncbi:unnamed protein product [Arabidopsis halleri]